MEQHGFGARPSKIKIVSFWTVTLLLALELLVGALFDFNIVNKGAAQAVLSRIGYPGYFILITGVAKIPAAIVILLPGFKLLKEWAYAGTFFLFAGACISHIAAKDYSSVAVPLIFSVLTLLSWWLRPASRKIATTG
ncbi:MAG TPA: DoxX family protein [Puia sp.]|jgi:hypothetical protein|nr:DoxX family protein [Puia sp.]